MKIGDEISVQHETLDEKTLNKRIVTRRGRIIFVNRAHHLFTVEYPDGQKESFKMTRPVDDPDHHHARSRAY